MGNHFPFDLISNQMPDDEAHDSGEGGLAVQQAKPALKQPPLFQVVLLNDDYTPMDFVVEVLEGFFGLDREQATRVMLAVHYEGKGVAGVYPRDIAETKAQQVVNHAREHEHPLMCRVEQKSG